MECNWQIRFFLIFQIVMIQFFYVIIFFFQIVLLYLQHYVSFFLLILIIVAFYFDKLNIAIFIFIILIILNLPLISNCFDFKKEFVPDIENSTRTILEICNTLNKDNKTQTVYGKKLINSKKILKTLDTYVCIIPTSTVLLIWGPKSSGKSASISNFKEKWKTHRRIIQIDLKEFSGGYKINNFKNFLKKSIQEALSDIIIDYQTHDFIFKNFKFENEKLHNYFGKSVFDYLGFPEEIRKSFNFITKLLKINNIYKLDAFLINNLDTNDLTGSDIIQTIQILDKLAIIKPELGIILIINELQDLDNIKDGSVSDKMLNYFRYRKQEMAVMPIIIETSDFLWSKKNCLLSNKESFTAIKVHLMKKKHMEKDLVENWKSLKKDEFDILWSVLGGHGGSWNTIFSILKTNSIINSIKILRHDTINRFSGIINNLKNEKENVIKYLKFFDNHNYTLPSLYEDNILSILIENNILIVDNLKVIPQNKLMKYSIRMFVITHDLVKTMNQIKDIENTLNKNNDEFKKKSIELQAIRKEEADIKDSYNKSKENEKKNYLGKMDEINKKKIEINLDLIKINNSISELKKKMESTEINLNELKDKAKKASNLKLN